VLRGEKNKGKLREKKNRKKPYKDVVVPSHYFSKDTNSSACGSSTAPLMDNSPTYEPLSCRPKLIYCTIPVPNRREGIVYNVEKTVVTD